MSPQDQTTHLGEATAEDPEEQPASAPRRSTTPQRSSSDHAARNIPRPTNLGSRQAEILRTLRYPLVTIDVDDISPPATNSQGESSRPSTASIVALSPASSPSGAEAGNQATLESDLPLRVIHRQLEDYATARMTRAEGKVGTRSVSVWIPRAVGQPFSYSMTIWRSPLGKVVMRDPPPTTFTPLEEYFANDLPRLDVLSQPDSGSYPQAQSPPSYEEHESAPPYTVPNSLPVLRTLYEDSQRSGSHRYYSTVHGKILSRLPIRSSYLSGHQWSLASGDEGNGLRRARIISECHLSFPPDSVYRSWSSIYHLRPAEGDSASVPYMIKPDFDLEQGGELAEHLFVDTMSDHDDMRTVSDAKEIHDYLLKPDCERKDQELRRLLGRYIDTRIVCLDSEYTRSLPLDPKTHMRYCPLPKPADIGDTWTHTTQMEFDARTWFCDIPFIQHARVLDNPSSNLEALTHLVDLAKIFYPSAEATRAELPMTRAVDETFRDLCEGLERLHDSKPLVLSRHDLQPLILQGIHACKSAYSLMKPDLYTHSNESRSADMLSEF